MLNPKEYTMQKRYDKFASRIGGAKRGTNSAGTEHLAIAGEELKRAKLQRQMGLDVIATGTELQIEKRIDEADERLKIEGQLRSINEIYLQKAKDILARPRSE